jgi:hypothetical protein
METVVTVNDDMSAREKQCFELIPACRARRPGRLPRPCRPLTHRNSPISDESPWCSTAFNTAFVARKSLCRFLLLRRVQESKRYMAIPLRSFG